MGRATEGFHYVQQEKLDKDKELLYTSLTITEEIKQLRKKVQLQKKTCLKVQDDGTFSLF